MRLRSISKLRKIYGQTVLLRADLNVKLNEQGQVGADEDFKIKRLLPTIKYLNEKGAKLIIMTHLGRPKGKPDSGLRLTPIADRLSSLLHKKIHKLDQVIGQEVENFVSQMLPGQILMLENLRFDSGEENNSKKFAKSLAALGDVYVNDAFAVSHHPAASLTAITKYLPSYAGFLLQSEVAELTKVLKRPARPLVVILGGAKISSKLGLIDNISRTADKVLLGGGLANNFLAALGYQTGDSLVEKDLVSAAKKLYKKYQTKILLPTDVTVDDSRTKSVDAYQKDVAELKASDRIIDIGTKTVLAWAKEIKLAKTIFWNGPLGLVEDKKASHSSRALTELIAAKSRRNCYSIVGGGETVWLIENMGLFNDFDYVSTGGGAMIEFLQAGTLPAIKPLLKKFI